MWVLVHEVRTMEFSTQKVEKETDRETRVTAAP